MAGLCEDGNEPSGSLKAIYTTMERNTLMAQCYPRLKDYCREKHGLEFQMASNFPDSPHTARRRFRERGIRCRPAVGRENLTKEHAVDRLAYATLRQDFDWRNVIFSDEVIVSSSNDGPALVYRMNGHQYDERFRIRLNRRDVDLIDWSSKSPDMNPIENLWAEVKRILRPPVLTADELWDRVLDAWEEVVMNLDLFHNLVDSMPRRMRAVVDAGKIEDSVLRNFLLLDAIPDDSGVAVNLD
ncbi:hypothetical protein ANN_19272 [Periplaneta americana]|uniref:Tc1-like transposase DDE domain-containing protein n=1 Tax=Periplaneta americana TaxID=6978 RepID=A0ABQ8S9X0_PERAM|nr:hypothetical protein ANN_19272 [Periplaneta americana]